MRCSSALATRMVNALDPWVSRTLARKRACAPGEPVMVAATRAPSGPVTVTVSGSAGRVRT